MREDYHNYERYIEKNAVPVKDYRGVNHLKSSHLDWNIAVVVNVLEYNHLDMKITIAGSIWERFSKWEGLRK